MSGSLPLELRSPANTLIAAVVPYAPYSYDCAVQVRLDPNHCKYPGIDYEIFMHIVELLNISVRLHPIPVVTNWGTQVDNGLLKELSDGKFDTMAVFYDITEIRLKVFDYSYNIPYTANRLGFIVSKPDENLNLESGRLLVKMFPGYIWLMTITAVITFTILQLISNTANQFTKDQNNELSKTHMSAFWTTLTIIVDQFNQNVSTGTVSGNFVTVLLGITILLITSLYKGGLVGSLIRSVHKIPFNTMTEAAALISARKYKMMYDCGVSSGFFWEAVKSSNLSSFQALNKSINSDTTITECNMTKLLDMMELNTNYILPAQDMLNGGLYHMRGRCKLTYIEDLEYSTIPRTGFMFRKNDPFIKSFSAVISGLSAMVYTTEQKYIRMETNINKKMCSSQPAREGDPLVMRHFYGIFYVCGIMITSALLTLLFEIGYRRVKSYVSSRKKRKENKTSKEQK